MLAANPYPRLRDSSGKFIKTPQPPTIKQLWKWAETFCWRNEIWASNLLSVNRNNIEILRGFSNRLNRLINKYEYITRKSSTFQPFGSSGTVARVNFLDFSRLLVSTFDRFKHTLSSLRTDVDYLLNQLSEVRKKKMLLNPKEVFNDILLLTEYMSCTYISEQRSLEIYTPPVVLHNNARPNVRYNLGQFAIRLRPDLIPEREFVLEWELRCATIRPLTPRYARHTSSECSHPHIAPLSSTLCFGQGKQAAYKAISEGRIYDFVQLILSVLNNYGGNSGLRPYIALENWDGVCDEKINPETNAVVPHDCPIEGAHTVTCSQCDRQASTIYTCSSCSAEGCGNCIGICEMPECGRRLCPEHNFMCVNCGGMFCEEHFDYDQDRCIQCRENTYSNDDDWDDDNEDDRDDDNVNEEEDEDLDP